MASSEAKRFKSGPASSEAAVLPDELAVGDEVRLVNLPAFPGLEGLLATVVSIDDDNVDVELKKNGVVKRVSLTNTYLPIPHDTP